MHKREHSSRRCYEHQCKDRQLRERKGTRRRWFSCRVHSHRGTNFKHQREEREREHEGTRRRWFSCQCLHKCKHLREHNVVQLGFLVCKKISQPEKMVCEMLPGCLQLVLDPVRMTMTRTSINQPALPCRTYRHVTLTAHFIQDSC